MTSSLQCRVPHGGIAQCSFELTDDYEEAYETENAKQDSYPHLKPSRSASCLYLWHVAFSIL
jgi:hypothetical protein